MICWFTTNHPPTKHNMTYIIKKKSGLNDMTKENKTRDWQIESSSQVSDLVIGITPSDFIV